MHSLAKREPSVSREGQRSSQHLPLLPAGAQRRAWALKLVPIRSPWVRQHFSEGRRPAARHLWVSKPCCLRGASIPWCTHQITVHLYSSSSGGRTHAPS